MDRERRRESAPRLELIVQRVQLLRLVHQLDSQFVFFFAPSGWGKTCLASQISGQAVNSRWVDLRRGDVLGGLATEAESLSQMGSVVVFDDLDLKSPSAPEVVRVLDALRSTKARVIVTTRSDPARVIGRLGAVAVLDQTDLRFSHEEALALGALMGLNADDVEVVDGSDSVDGHPLLTRVTLLEKDAAARGHSRGSVNAVHRVVRQLVAACLTQDERSLLVSAAILERGSIADLNHLGSADTRRCVETIARKLPLIRLIPNPATRQLGFEVHPLLGGLPLQAMEVSDWPLERMGESLKVLAKRSQWDRARDLLDAFADSETVVEFLDRHAESMVRERHEESFLDLVNRVPLASLMARPRIFPHWSSALQQQGDYEEAAAKAAATIPLARHEGDFKTLARAVCEAANTLRDQGRAQEAVEQLEALVREAFTRVNQDTQCEILIAYGNALGMAGRLEDARSAFQRAGRIVNPSSTQAHALKRAWAYSYMVWTGEHAEGVRALAPLLETSSGDTTTDQFMMGNLAWQLAEMGRVDRALVTFSQLNLPVQLRSIYDPIAALAKSSSGDLEGALKELSSLDQIPAASMERTDRLVHLLYRSAIRRAAGLLEESLSDAERAFEGFLHCDHVGFSRLAVVEMAASLVALGDVAAAGDWLLTPDIGWETVNKLHMVSRAAMLAIVRLRQGDADFLGELDSSETYIASGSANWRLAMYVRAFPDLLGILCRVAGASRIPGHLLKCVGREGLEEAILLARPLLSNDDWLVLGKRALGEEQFAEFLARKGRPICRVRLFGSLEVIADGRAVTERDWRKRKARLLFAMLVVRRGQDIPRDVILEHLWPDLSEDKAKNNFYVAWSTMKAALMGPENKEGLCPYIESRRGRCHIVSESVHSDVDDFESLIAKARTADAEGRSDDAIAALQELMSVYRGDLLPGDVYDDWFSSLRDRYRFEFIDAMLRGVELLLEKDDPYEALVFARRGLMIDAYREDLYQAALKCQILAGQRSAAIETFIQCKTQLAEELGLDPAAETMALYQQILSMEERPRYDTYGLTSD